MYLINIGCFLLLCFKQLKLEENDEPSCPPYAGRVATATEILYIYEHSHLNITSTPATYPLFNTTNLLITKRMVANDNILFGIVTGVNEEDWKATPTHIVCVSQPLGTHFRQAMVFVMLMSIIYLLVIAIAGCGFLTFRRNRQLRRQGEVIKGVPNILTRLVFLWRRPTSSTLRHSSTEPRSSG